METHIGGTFFHILGISSQLTFTFLRGVETSNQLPLKLPGGGHQGRTSMAANGNDGLKWFKNDG